MPLDITSFKRRRVSVFVGALSISFLGSIVAAEHPGNLDSRFGHGGTTNLPTADLGASFSEHVLVDDINRVLFSYNTTGGGAIGALTVNGTVDSSFGTAGTISLTDILYDVKIDSLGRLIALTNRGTGFQLTRYQGDGTIDTGFGIGGSAQITSGAGDIDGIAMQTDEDNNIIVLGTDYSFPSELKMLAAKVDDRGSLDLHFGSSGFTTVAVAPPGMDMTYPRAVALDKKGSIYLDGYTARSDGVLVTSIAKLTSTGRIDTGFGGGSGYVQVDADPASSMFRYTASYSILVDTHDRVVVGGSATNGSVPQLFVARYESDGTPDPSFSGGTVLLAIDGAIEADSGHVLLDARGRVVITGAGVVPSYDTYLAAARLNDDGTIDTSFGHGGTELLPTSAWNGYSAFTHDQSILILGDAADGSAIMIDQLIGNSPMVVPPPSHF